MGERLEEKKENLPLLVIDKKLAQLIGWMANLVGMVRKFPQGRDRDKAVFVSRKILKTLRALRGEKIRPFLEAKKEEKEIRKEKPKQKLKQLEEKPKRRLVKEEAKREKESLQGKEKAAEKEEKIIFKKRPS